MRLLTLAAVALLASLASAQGWTDYSLDIGDGYQIVRANSIDIMLCRDSAIVLDRDKGPNLGPIVGYAKTPTHILTKHAGTKPRNLFEGDTFLEVDATKTFYCIVPKGSEDGYGPYNESEFYARPELAGITQVDWTAPHNPNIIAPLLGALFFLAISIPILVVGKPLVGIPLLLLLLLLAYAAYRLLGALTRLLLRRLRPHPAA